MKSILLLVHPQLHPARRGRRKSAEHQVWTSLKKLGYAVEILPLLDDPRKLEKELVRVRPYAAFNLLEEFREEAVYDFHLPAYLEARGIPCTGCNPRGLVLSRNKYLVTQVARASGIDAPYSALFGNQKYTGPYPAFVKFNREHASRGIGARNRVMTAPAIQKVVRRMRKKYEGEILVQEFVGGTDVTVSLLGNGRVKIFRPWKLNRKSPLEFSTERVKFNSAYRFDRGIRAGGYRGELTGQLKDAAQKMYRELELSGYARMDFRVTDKRAVLVDVNPNPNLELGEDFACSARDSGIEYTELIKQILQLSRNYRPRI